MKLRELINYLEDLSEDGKNDNLPVFLYGSTYYDEVEEAFIEPDRIELL